MAKLRNFFNKILNNNRIFTAKDIGEMSGKEYEQNEKAIFHQLQNLGIPRRNQLSGNSDVVYVNSYIKSDGTKVKAHYRSKNGGISSNNSTGFAADIEQPTLLKSGISYYEYPFNFRTAIDDVQETENTLWSSANKYTLDFGINSLGNKIGEPDAVGMWNIASRPNSVETNMYLSGNGRLYDNIESLNNEYAQYKDKIKEKVKSQFGKEDVQGVVFHEYSSVAKAVSNSQELNDFINKNLKTLKLGEKITGSLGFTSNKNLRHAFGKVDILSAKLNNNYVDVILLDTYDFNPNEKSLLVNMGYAAQKGALLNPYFTIVKCRYKL